MNTKVEIDTNPPPNKLPPRGKFNGGGTNIQNVADILEKIFNQGLTTQNLNDLDNTLSKCTQDEKDVIGRSQIVENPGANITSTKDIHKNRQTSEPTVRSTIKDVRNPPSSNPAWLSVINIFKKHGLI